MTKKVGIIFVLFIIGIGAMYMKMGANNISNKNNKKTNEKEIGNINNMSLSKTNYKYDEEINGYKYEKVELSNSAKDLIKQELTGLKLDNNATGIVYGKYKLEIDDIILFFDLNNDIALLKNKNYIIKLNNSFKKQLVNNDDVCSCCNEGSCLINICSCKRSNL